MSEQAVILNIQYKTKTILNFDIFSYR